MFDPQKPQLNKITFFFSFQIFFIIKFVILPLFVYTYYVLASIKTSCRGVHTCANPTFVCLFIILYY